MPCTPTMVFTRPRLLLSDALFSRVFDNTSPGQLWRKKAPPHKAEAALAETAATPKTSTGIKLGIKPFD
ncbi:hypothetical protein GCM10022252_32530 [Streptosporangium oxazolinicum]|uniref:Uncharacterized protein n=1 Tax=Streptosporangium oxazolinicum TaxID=909287 RepID=A0ABP8AW28_9ACTN